MTAGPSGPVSQLCLPIEAAPAALRDHGYRDAHSWPLVSPDVGKVRCSFRVAPSVAWDYPRLELRTGNSYPILSFDCDGPESVDRLMAAVIGADLSEPNVITQRRASGNCHAQYMLGTPVHRGDKARLAPLQRLARISEFYQDALLADPGYNGVLTLNPAWSGGEFITFWLRRAPYEMDELAEVIPDGWRRPTIAQTGIGKNVDLFRWAVQEAHRPRSARLIHAAGVRDAPEWIAVVNARNVAVWGTGALPYNEVRGVAKSAAGYSLRQWSEQIFSEIQRRRKYRQAKVRRANTAERDELIRAMARQGWSQRAIATAVGVNQSTASRVLQRGDALAITGSTGIERPHWRPRRGISLDDKRSPQVARSAA